MESMSKPEIAEYLNSISRYPVLTPEAQLRHCYRVREWVEYQEREEEAPKHVERRARKSIDVMTRTNLRLVVTVAKNYLNRGMDFHDVIQEGNIGLIKAIKLFDPTRGYAFSTYAYWWIRQSITIALQNNLQCIRIPVHAQEDFVKIKNFTSEYQEEYDHAPMINEIAAAVGLSVKRTAELVALSTTSKVVSLDTYTANNGGHSNSLPFCEAVPAAPTICNSPEAALEANQISDILASEISNLEPIQQALIIECYYRHRPINEVSEELGLKKYKATQLRRRALAKLKTGCLLHDCEG
jgi:RNA polymerase primary sigma factor